MTSFLLWAGFTFFVSNGFAQLGLTDSPPAKSVELNGDTIEYLTEGSTVFLKGNVVIVNGATTLTADEVEFDRTAQIAKARGNVILKTGQGEISGDKLTFNFGTMAGDFYGTRIAADPYFGKGEKVTKTKEKITMHQGNISTCDHDKPHYSMASKKIDIYPGDKMIARNIRIMIGKLPVGYLPWIRQRLAAEKPVVTFTPGVDKDWGAFLLSKAGYQFGENLAGNLRLDYRRLRGVGAGFDLKYNTKSFGSGLINTYGMSDKAANKYNPEKETFRYKNEWRHRWKIDSKTNALVQVYQLSDSAFLKDIFRNEYRKDPSPDTFFILTRTLPKGILTFRTDLRVNQFESRTDRFPEVRYDLSSQEIGNTGLFLRDTTTLTALAKKVPFQTKVSESTVRFDTDNEVSYPTKVGIVEFKPYVGGRFTYYSNARKDEDDGSLRGQFRTGASLSTKFYRVFEPDSEIFGQEIQKLRHIVTPSVSYSFVADPTIPSSRFYSFDGIDSQAGSHRINFSIENKLQVKRNDKTVELARAIISVPYALKEDPRKQGFGNIIFDLDFRPTDWLKFYFDSNYDTRNNRLSTANFDLYINGKDKWNVGIGKRFNGVADDQITTSFNYKLNQKWRFRMFDRFDIDEKALKEQQYSFIRDLHAWEMEFNFNQARGNGTQMVVLFRLKAFPGIGFDFGTSLNQRKGGAQRRGGSQ